MEGGERVLVSIMMEDHMKAETEMKVKKHKTGMKYRGIIYNSTIKVDQEESKSSFLSSLGPNREIHL